MSQEARHFFADCHAALILLFSLHGGCVPLIIGCKKNVVLLAAFLTRNSAQDLVWRFYNRSDIFWCGATCESASCCLLFIW